MRSLTILLAEDEPIISLAIRHLLEKNGLRVILASDALEVMDCCEQHRPDVVVLNVMLPGSNGMALAGLLKRRFKLPVRFITGARPQDVAASQDFDSSLDILYKPFTPAQLRQWVSGPAFRKFFP